jgi:transposase
MTFARTKLNIHAAVAAVSSNGLDAPTHDGIDVPKWSVNQPLEPRGACTMKMTAVGINVTENVFQIHAVDERGKTVSKKQLKRSQMAEFFVNLPPCLIGMQACGSAHHWARAS